MLRPYPPWNEEKIKWREFDEKKGKEAGFPYPLGEFLQGSSDFLCSKEINEEEIPSEVREFVEATWQKDDDKLKKYDIWRIDVEKIEL